MVKRDKKLEIVMLPFLALYAMFCVLPVLLVVIVSFTKETAIQRNGYSFFPTEWSTAAYKLVFHGNPLIISSFEVSILITVVGTLLAVIITYMAAFALANSQLKYRNAFALLFFITMIFNTGLVPWYIMCKNFGLLNNIWSLIIPSLVFNPFNLFLTRNFMNGIPHSLMESAKIDGANDITIAFRIYMPLSKPVLATIALFYGIGYWNNWFNAIMLVDNQKLYPLQYMLFRLKSDLAMMSQLQSTIPQADAPSDSFKMAMAVLTIGPIVLLYPLLQRYFVKGLIIGSVKG